ncbi:hypothetical protein LCGC14_2654800 [marine sediment metagenome]|uniref:Uncharacterized protein n=1 Tax=marine sediment metagenome TaxID=412755 RepID=A0A0F8ZTT0_9ZZZZ
MTNKTLEAVTRAIRFSHESRQAQAAIDAYLKALEKEGKCVISKHDLQELTTNRTVYEG